MYHKFPFLEAGIQLTCLFADAGRAHQEHGPLLFNGDGVIAELILGEIRLHGAPDLLFRFFDVHGRGS